MVVSCFAVALSEARVKSTGAKLTGASTQAGTVFWCGEAHVSFCSNDSSQTLGLLYGTGMSLFFCLSSNCFVSKSSQQCEFSTVESVGQM